MSLKITGKHMNVGESLSQKIDDRIADAVQKYFDGGYSGHVILEKTNNAFECDCGIHLDTGVILQAKGRSFDPQIAFDEACDRIEKRLRRYKRRLKDHRQPNRVAAATTAATAYVMEPPQEEDVPEDYAPAIIAEAATELETQTVAQAVMQLDLTDKPFIFFTNAANGNMNVVYWRPDGNIGWIDPKKG